MKQASLSYKNNRELLRKADQLPQGAEWIHEVVSVPEDALDEAGKIELSRRRTFAAQPPSASHPVDSVDRPALSYPQRGDSHTTARA